MTEPKKTSTKAADALGYDVYAKTLWERIERSLSKQTLGDDPLVVGVFGEWGAGKSKLLELIHDLAKTKNDEDCNKRSFQSPDEPLSLTVPVWFHPWKYEHEAHMGVPLLMHLQVAIGEALVKAATPLEELFHDASDTTTAGKKFAKAAHKQVKTWTKVLQNEYLQVGLGVAAGALFTPAAGVATTAGLKWLADSGKSIVENTSVVEKFETSEKSKPISDVPLVTLDGSYYYKTHEMLRKLTRIKPLEKGKTSTIKGLDSIRRPVHLNFVVFVDDLDRCLPEKSVQVLELIKTLLNVDSFAFVLALDDEVIERGIGHRYKDYALVGKKPEMPITGFEYLEKIVHLPFRLPALTIDQAEKFVRHHEEAIEENSALRWFDPITIPVIKNTGGDAEGEIDAIRVDGSWAIRGHQRSDLLALALAGFDAYVPRKLIRMVELVHQIATIARSEQRKTPISFEPHATRDARIILALVLIQLFQPELFRIMLRKRESFSILLAAFSPKPATESDTLLPAYFTDAEVSNVDLWRWVIDNKPNPTSIVWDTSSLDGIPNYVVNFIAKQEYTPKERADAQQVRFPLVSQLVAHRAAQRHVFDVLKLMKALSNSMDATNSRPYEFDASKYITFLAQSEVNNQTVTVSSARSTMHMTSRSSSYVMFTILNPEALVADLLTDDLAVQANISSRHELRDGQKLDNRSFAPVFNGLSLKAAQNTLNRINLLNGLQYLAPYITPVDQLETWKLVETSVDFTKPVDPKLRAQWYDVRASFGCDFRFTDNLALAYRQDKPTERNGNISDAPEAPSGFVKCPIPESGEYVFDDGDEMRPQRRPYYISRFAVTVAQYAAFVTANGYEDQALWEASHKDAWLWRTGEFDSSKTIEDKIYKDWLARRPVDLRNQPMEWTEQLANLNRPVTGVTWFEATAYAAWLEAQRQKGEGGVDWWGTLKDPQYRLRLPTEGEWESAARASGTGQFPWGDGDSDIDQRANVDDKVGRPTTVGSYAPNALGLYDMAGNVWEWQANLYENQYEKDLIHANTPLKIGKTWEESDKPSLRGGSWADRPDDARCSSRDGLHPVDWGYGIGFRLVLSLADFES